jgi:hypothetical protein
MPTSRSTNNAQPRAAWVDFAYVIGDTHTLQAVPRSSAVLLPALTARILPGAGPCHMIQKYKQGVYWGTPACALLRPSQQGTVGTAWAFLRNLIAHTHLHS